ncbi:MAG: hypothetical protein OEY70_15160 [Acidimicrobiia bacterium]|nr:hypothetical protein [Acidimicrobiia bacterium]
MAHAEDPAPAPELALPRLSGPLDPDTIARFGILVLLVSDLMVFAAFFAATYLPLGGGLHLLRSPGVDVRWTSTWSASTPTSGSGA